MYVSRIIWRGLGDSLFYYGRRSGMREVSGATELVEADNSLDLRGNQFAAVTLGPESNDYGNAHDTTPAWQRDHI